MSAHDAHAFSAIAFQLAQVLDAYERDVASMLRGTFDADAYRRVSGHVDEMRMYSASLSPVSGAWVEVLIRHFELTHGLWRVQKEGPGAADLDQLHARLREALQRLSRKCVQLMPAA